MATAKVRKLTIARKYITARRRIVPEISLCGDWLKALGFAPGAGVTVTTVDGRLIIEPRF